MQIRRDDLRSPEVADLLEIHLAHAEAASPRREHACFGSARVAVAADYLLDRLGRRDSVGVWLLRELDPSHGEIKSMHTAAQFRGRGVAKALLIYIIAEARSRSYSRLSLETGSMDAFGPARALYSRFGFVVCSPFAEYVVDPNSVFMTLDLTRGAP